MSSERARLIIICGLPGSGKTTLAKSLAQDTGGTVFSSDEWMDALDIDIWDQGRQEKIERLQWQVARQMLVIGGTAIIEWGTWARSERDTLRIQARTIGAAVELRHLTASPEVLFERISRRARENPPITLDMVRLWSTAFEIPSPEEFALFDDPIGEPT